MDEGTVSEGRRDCSTVLRNRWIVLLTVVYLNISNAMLWHSYSSVANMASEYFSMNEKYIDLLSLVFCLFTVVFGVLVVWIVDNEGLRFAILLGAWFNCAGAAIRALNGFWGEYAIAMTGQVLAAIAQPFIYCIPTKVAEQWFPEQLRVIATCLPVIGNLVGQLIGCGVTPLFVTDKSKIPSMNYFYGIPCGVGAVVASICIRFSKPETPPSCSAQITTNYPYLFALKSYLKKKDSLLLLIATGNILSVSYIVASRMEEILCTQGYDDKFSGQCSLILISGGILGAVASSRLADLKKNFILIIKLALVFMALCLIAYFVAVQYANQGILIRVICGLLGFFAYAAFPVGLELAMEQSFTILPEATSTGLIIMFGQIFSTIFWVFFNFLSTDWPNRDSTCRPKHTFGQEMEATAHHTTYPLMAMTIVVTVFVILFVAFFKGDYNRMKTENRSMSAIVNDDDPIISSASYDDISPWQTSIYS